MDCHTWSAIFASIVILVHVVGGVGDELPAKCHPDEQQALVEFRDHLVLRGLESWREGKGSYHLVSEPVSFLRNCRHHHASMSIHHHASASAGSEILLEIYCYDFHRLVRRMRMKCEVLCIVCGEVIDFSTGDQRKRNEDDKKSLVDNLFCIMLSVLFLLFVNCLSGLESASSPLCVLQSLTGDILLPTMAPAKQSIRLGKGKEVLGEDINNDMFFHRRENCIIAVHHRMQGPYQGGRDIAERIATYNIRDIGDAYEDEEDYDDLLTYAGQGGKDLLLTIHLVHQTLIYFEMDSTGQLMEVEEHEMPNFCFDLNMEACQSDASPEEYSKMVSPGDICIKDCVFDGFGSSKKHDFAGKMGFVEQRSFTNFYWSFDRLWEMLILKLTIVYELLCAVGDWIPNPISSVTDLVISVGVLLPTMAPARQSYMLTRGKLPIYFSFLKEFLIDPFLSSYVIDDFWEDMKAMRNLKCINFYAALDEIYSTKHEFLTEDDDSSMLSLYDGNWSSVVSVFYHYCFYYVLEIIGHVFGLCA